VTFLNVAGRRSVKEQKKSAHEGRRVRYLFRKSRVSLVRKRAVVNSKSDHSLPYMPQLDSLRALAVLAVLNHHFFPQDIWVSLGVSWGALGVRLFFVLSGFLITTILLRDFAVATSLPLSYGKFVQRRATRLYPVLLVTLLVGAALDLYHVRQTLPYTLTYTFNFYAAATADWHGPVAHLWSLAVEEQFYLLWPLVLFIWLRKGYPIIPLLISLIVCSLASRIGMSAYGVGSVARETMPLASVDALALGALVAVLGPKHRAIAIIGGAGLLLLTITAIPSPLFPDYETSLLAASMIFAWIIACAAGGFSGVTGAILNNAALRYIGIISYGIYVLHNFVPHYLDLFGLRNIGLLPFGALATITTIALAAVSWHLLERPIMRAFRPRSLLAPQFEGNLEGGAALVRPGTGGDVRS
jgi:peptidoglycan/LPS O-acetylase OafA/YrhL